MNFVQKFFARGKNKSATIVSENETFATVEQAGIYFRELLSHYSEEFSVDTPEQQLFAYRNIAQLNTIISRSAKAFIRGKEVLYEIKKDGSRMPLENGELYNVLENPHVLQSKNKFWEAVYINNAVFGRHHVLKNESVGYGLKSMLCLPSANVSIFLKDNPKYLTATSLDQIIDYYQLDEIDKQTKITDVDSVWTMRDLSLSTNSISEDNSGNSGNGLIDNENPLKPIEKELGLLNTIKSVKSELLENHGAKGIISPDGKDSSGSIPLLPIDKKELQRDYSSYGLTKGKDKLLITNKAVKFTAISLKIAELLLTEFEQEANNTIANKLAYPTSLLSNNVTYENKDAANKELYENKIFPETKYILEDFNINLGLKEQNLVYEFDFSDISFLQTDQKTLADRNLIISENVIKLNTAVADGKMSKESAIFNLVTQGENEESAKKLIS